MRRIKSTTGEITFNYDFQGKTKEKVLETTNIEILNFEEVTSAFSSEQQTDVDKQTVEILAKMNSTRTTADRPQLKKEDCVMLR